MISWKPDSTKTTVWVHYGQRDEIDYGPLLRPTVH